MNAAQIIDAITWIEVSSAYPADCRSVLRDERFRLIAAVRDGDDVKIAAAIQEAQRVARMWGVDLAHVQMPSA